MGDSLALKKKKAAAAAAALKQRETQAVESLGQRPGAVSLPRGSEEALGPASVSGSALRGFGQGATLGFADELVASATQGIPALAARAFMSPEQYDEMMYQVFGVRDASAKTPGQQVESVRRDELTELAQSRRAHPVVTTGAEIAGAVLTPTPKISRIGGAPLTRVGERAATGALAGGLVGAGTARPSLMQGDSAADVATEAGKGAAFGAIAGPLLGAGMDKAGAWLRQAAQANALKALGVRAGLSNQLAQRGYETPAQGRELGQAALDLDLIPFGGKAEDVALRATEAKPRYGSLIEDALSRADDAARAREAAKVTRYQDAIAAARAEGKGRPVWPEAPQPVFDKERAAWEAASEVLGSEGLSPTAMREAVRARRLVDDVTKLEDPTFRAANKLKSDMYAGIKYGTDPALKVKLEQDAARGLRKSIEGQMEDVAGKEAAEQLRFANQRYGQMLDIEGLARDEAQRQAGRKTLTAMDIMSMGVGAGAGSAAAGPAGAIAGVALPALRGVLGPRMPSAIARTEQFLAPRVPQMAPAATKAAIMETQRPSLSEEEAAAVDAFASGGI